MGQLDEITDAQLQSWIGVTESAIEAEMRYVKFFCRRKRFIERFCRTRRCNVKTYRGDRISPRDA
jgi:hypothetical protein